MITTPTRLGGRSLALALAFALAGPAASTAAAAPAPAGDVTATSPAASTSPVTTSAPDATSKPAEPTAEAGSPETDHGNAAAPQPAARAAYADAVALMEKGEHAQAIAKADLAAEIEPTWSAPVQLRAEAFAALAQRYEPSAAFTSAHAAELEPLLVLEPEVDAQARQRQIDALRQHAREAHELEQRRRRLDIPAFMLAITATGLFVGGAMLYGMKPREFLEPTAFLQERRDRAGIVLMVAGGALVPPAIALGVLSARQKRTDAAVRDLEIETNRSRARLRIGPQLVRGGGGAGLMLRF